MTLAAVASLPSGSATVPSSTPSSESITGSSDIIGGILRSYGVSDEHRFTKVRQLGRGAQGTVDLVEKANEDGSTRRFASKRMLCDNELDLWMHVWEVDLLRQLDCPNIVHYEDCYVKQVDQHVFVVSLVMELCAGGDLQQEMDRRAAAGEPFAEADVLVYLAQMATALQYLHSSVFVDPRYPDEERRGQMVFRDLKPANLLFRDAARRTLCLGDFGVSRILSSLSGRMTSHTGTVLYMAPELFTAGGAGQLTEATAAVDCFSLGAVLFAMLTLGSAPTCLTIEATQHNYDPERRLRPALVASGRYSEELIALTLRLLCRNPADRPTADDLCALPLLQPFLRGDGGSVSVAAGNTATVAAAAGAAAAATAADAAAAAVAAATAATATAGTAATAASASSVAGLAAGAAAAPVPSTTAAGLAARRGTPSSAPRPIAIAPPPTGAAAAIGSPSSVPLTPKKEFAPNQFLADNLAGVFRNSSLLAKPLMSGVRTHAAVATAYTELRRRKCRFILMGIEREQVVLKHRAPPAATWDDFVALLPADSCRYGAFDACVPRGNGTVREVLCFVTWCPTGAPIREKMIYASSGLGVSRSFEGIQCSLQACDRIAVTWEALVKKAVPNAPITASQQQ